jgi:plastocyanin
VALVLSACGSSSSAPPTATHAAAKTPAARKLAAAAKPKSGHVEIAIRNFAYSPMHVTVTAGTKVSWHNYDATAHTATAVNQSFDTGTVNPNQTRTVTFKKPGTYTYKCLFHAFMMASITVVPAKG